MVRKFNYDNAVELSEETFLKIAEIMQKESMYINFELKENTVYNEFKLLYELTHNENFAECMKHFEGDNNKPCGVVFTLYPLYYTNNVVKFEVAGNVSGAVEVAQQELLKVLPMLWFDIKNFNSMI